jgi:peroxiredoxin
LKQPTTLSEAFEAICVLDAPLNARLHAYAERLRELNFPFAEAYDTLVARLYAGEIGAEAPAVGERMPPFILPARSVRLVALEELLAKGPVVISFNRGHWCPFCRIELRTIAAYHDELASTGAHVVSVMPDRQRFVGGVAGDTDQAIDILTDVDNGYALSLGLVMWLGDQLRELMRGRGYHLETFHGNDGWFVPLPATFVVGSDGRVLARFVDPALRTRMEVDDTLAALAKERPQNLS